jgi:hypothetical protein
MRRALCAWAPGGDGNDVVVEVGPFGGGGGGGGGEPPAGDDCSGDFPPAPFTDVDPASVHSDAIDCVAGLGVTSGTSPTTFTPGGIVTRGQLATFIANAIEVSGYTMPTGSPDAFGDDEGER